VLSDRYAMVFLAFPGVGTMAEDAEANLDRAAQQYTEIIAAKLRRAPICGIDPVDAAAALLRICHVVNLQQFRKMFGLRNGFRIIASLAIAMQRLIFPGTANTVLAAVGTNAADQAVLAAAGLADPVGTEPDEPDAANVSPIRQDILSAASALFSERGYYAVSMDDVAAAAEVSRATLYRHFSTKPVLLGELSSWSVLESNHLSAELRDITAGPDQTPLRMWLARYVHFHRTYGGVIRAWYDGAIARQLPGDSVARGMRGLHRSVLHFLGQYRLPPGMDRGVAAAIFLAVLGRLSEYAAVQHPHQKDYETAGFMLKVLQRAVLGDGSER
jgi:AcrR family transcriptional regulator